MVWIILVATLSILLYAFGRFRRHYVNPYRLYMIFGKKGSGKTTRLVKIALKYIDRGWAVYTNVEDMDIEGVRFIDPEQIGDFVPEADSVLLLDEVGMIWDSRDFKHFRPAVRDFFKLQRHYQCLVYLASQSFDIDKKLRDLCDGMELCSCFLDVFSLTRPIVKTVVLTESQGDEESRISENLRFLPLWNWKITYIPRYAKYFDTHAIPEKPQLPYIER